MLNKKTFLKTQIQKAIKSFKTNKWISRYVGIIALSIVILMTILGLSNILLQREFRYTNISFTASLGRNMDNILTSNKQTIYQISNCPEFKQFVCKDYSNDSDLIYSSLLLSNTISSFVTGNYWVENVIVYSDKQQRIADISGANNPLDYYNTNLKEYIPWDTFKNALSGDMDNYYISFGFDNSQYLVNVVRKKYSNCNFTILVMLNTERIFENFVQSDFSDRGMFALLGEDNTLLIYDQGKITYEKSELHYEEIHSSPHKIDTTHFKGKRYQLSASNSKINRFVFLLFDDLSRTNFAILIQRLSTSLLFLISIGMSGHYIYKYMRSNSDHLRHLLHDTHYETYDIDTLYQKLETHIDKLRDKNIAMEKQLDNQKKSIVQNKLCNLLEYSNTDLTELQNSLDTLNVKFNHDYFLVIGFYLLDCNQVFYEHNENDDSTKNPSLCRFILENIFNEIISEIVPVYFTISNDILTGIVNLPSPSLIDVLKKNIEAGHNFICKEFCFKYYTFVSDVKSGIASVHELYTKMLSEFELTFFKYDENTDFQSELANVSTSKDNDINKVISFIHENINNKSLGVPMICEYMEVSSTKLSRDFKAKTGETIARYIQTKRIELAKHLLCNTDKTINEIADETGYDYSVSFIRSFKRIENMTPSEYRNLKQKGNNT